VLKRVKASLMEDSWSWVKLFSLASLEGRFLGAAWAVDGLVFGRRLGACVVLVSECMRMKGFAYHLAICD